MDSGVLDQEVAFFETKRKQLFRKHPGEFALIKAKELIGVYETDEEAYNEGVRLFGTDVFMIKRITKEDKPEQVPLLASFIRHADI